MKFSREHDQDLLVKSLNEAVKSAAIVARPDFAELLQAIVRARTVSKIVSLGRAWTELGVRDSLLQRLKVIKDGGKFARLHSPKSLSMFAEAI